MGFLTALQEGFYPSQPFAELPSDPGFSPGLARALAWASQLAYEALDDGKFRRILGRWDWSEPRTFTGRFASHLPLVSTKGFAARIGSETVIAFAGTEPQELLDWITDFYIHRTAEGVSAGFSAGVEAVWVQVAEAVRRSPRGVFLAGHSLGGALAAVAARRLLDEHLIEPDRLFAVCTAGMPRPGDEEYTRDYNAAGGGTLGLRTLRLVYGEDIVPTVPPAATPIGFRHVGQAWICPHGGTFAGAAPPGAVAEEAPAAGGLKAILDTFHRDLTAVPEKDPAMPPFPSAYPLVGLAADAFPPPLRDHLMDRYLRALQSPG